MKRFLILKMIVFHILLLTCIGIVWLGLWSLLESLL